MTTTPTSGSATCVVAPTETRGPFPDTVGMINNSTSETVSAAVYTSGVYAAHGQSTGTNNANDNVFSDGVTNELATVTGNTTSGYTAMLNVGIAI